MFTRRTATVTISAPDASCARCMMECDEYLPVPTISRDLKVRSAIVKVSATFNPRALALLTAPHEVHDFDLVPIGDGRPIERVLLDDPEIVLDGHAAGIDLQLRQQPRDADRRGDFKRIAVQLYQHCNSILYDVAPCTDWPPPRPPSRSPEPCSRRRRLA